VRKGTESGGDFRTISGCTKTGQLHCVISYATFGQTPPDDSFFGKLRDRPGTTTPWGSRYEALCTNPAALAGGSGRLRALYPSQPLYGVFGLVQRLMVSGSAPTASTAWVSPADRYTARCRTANKARVLMLDPLGTAPILFPGPSPQWGLHLMDLNLPLANLIKVTRTQIHHYERMGSVPTRHGKG